MARNHVRLPAMLDAIVILRRRVFSTIAVIPVLALLAAACGGPKIQRPHAAEVIQATPTFKSAKLLYLPRTLSIPADGISSSAATRQGEALNITEIATVDPVVAVLRARDQVAIEDFVSAVQSSIVIPPKPDSTPAQKTDTAGAPNDSAKAPPAPPPKLDEPHTSPPPAPPLAQAWVHTLRVTPRGPLETADLAPDDGDDNPEAPRITYSAKTVGRTPGWTLAIGSREFLRVLDVSSYSAAPGEPKGDAQVDFLWRWRPTHAGLPFDTESAEFQSLPKEVQQAALSGSVTMDTSSPHWSRATLARDGAGWKVTGINWAYGNDKPHDRW